MISKDKILAMYIFGLQFFEKKCQAIRKLFVYCFLQINRILAVSETRIAPPLKIGEGTTINTLVI